MVLISMWLTLVVNKYFAVIQCAHAWQIKNLAETNVVEIFGRAKRILSVQYVRTPIIRCLQDILQSSTRLEVWDYVKSKVLFIPLIEVRFRTAE